MPAADGKKIKGRFIKRGSNLEGVVKVSKYNFAKISRFPIVYPDNVNLNIMHARLHPEEELSDTDRDVGKYFEELKSVNVRSGVIWPRDFTDDWIEEKKKANRNRKRGYDDEDEYELALEDEILRQEEAAAKNLTESQPVAEDDFSEEKKEEVETVVEKSLEEVEEEEEAAADLSDFAPLSETKKNEEEVIEEVDSQPAVDEVDEERHKEAVDAAYKDGINAGKNEESERLQNLTQAFKQGIADLEPLQRQSLDQVQEHFYQLTLATCEAILSRSLKLDPKLFRDFIQKALDETVDPKEYLVKINPNTMDKLKEKSLLDTKLNWKADSELKEEEFVLESSEGLLHSNIRSIVSNILDSMDLKLFEET